MDGQRLYADTMATTPTTTREPSRFRIEVLECGAATKRTLTLTGLDTLLAQHPDGVTAINALRA